MPNLDFAEVLVIDATYPVKNQKIFLSIYPNNPLVGQGPSESIVGSEICR